MDKVKNKEEWTKAIIAEYKALDKSGMSFYSRITGQIVGTVPVTVGYVGKFDFGGFLVYYAAKDLLHLYQSWQYHCTYNRDINHRIKKEKLGDKYLIKEFKTLKSALAYAMK